MVNVGMKQSSLNIHIPSVGMWWVEGRGRWGLEMVRNHDDMAAGQ